MKSGVRVWLIATPVIVLLAAGGFFGYRWWHDRAPFSASAIHATGMVEPTDADTVTDQLDQLGGSALTPWLGSSGDELFVGQVSYQVPAGAHGAGRYAIVVIDTLNAQVSPLIWGTGPDRQDVTSGWEPALAAAGKRYSWLAPLAKPAGNGAATVVLLPADAPGPITFEGAFHADAGGITSDDLLVGLVFIGADGQIFWAQQL